MSADPHIHLSRRESQIMDAVYQLGEASVSEVVKRMPDEPGYNTVRNIMAVLEKKQYLKHRKEGQRYVYTPVAAAEQVKRSAVSHLLETFFHGSLPQAILAMVGTSADRLTEQDLDEIASYLERARRETR